MRVPKTLLSFLALANILVFAQDKPQAAVAESANIQSKPVVYVYRYKQFVGSALAPSVYCDDVQLARMDNGRYFEVNVDPGRHTFRSNDAQSGVQLELKGGQEYFIRVEIATGFMKGHGRLILTAPEQGRYELQSNKLKPLDANKVADSSRVSVNEAKFDKPLPPPTASSDATTTPRSSSKPADSPQKAQDAVATPNEVSLSDTVQGPTSEMSLGDAARKAKQKKSAADNAAAPPQ